MGANNFFVTFRWMNDYKLSNSERDLYAVIYGFSQGDSSFMGSQSYLADMVGVSRRTVVRCLKSLEEKGLVEKETYFNGNVANYAYYACIPSDKMSQGCDTMSQGGVTKCHRGCDKMSHNNIVDNIVDNNTLSLNAQARNKYGEYKNVQLTEDEYNKFKAECPKADEYIANLSEYMAMKKTSYKSHLAVLRNWYRRDREKEKCKEPAATSPKTLPSYDKAKFIQDVLNDDLVYTKRRKD